MSQALTVLAYTSVFLVVLWVPYILAAFYVRGVLEVLGYPESPKPLPAWADRAKRAHENLVQNFAPFAALVIIAEFASADAAAVGRWAAIFLMARIAHWAIYILKIPVIRTLAFLVGFAAQVMIFLAIANTGNFAAVGSVFGN